MFIIPHFANFGKMRYNKSSKLKIGKTADTDDLQG